MESLYKTHQYLVEHINLSLKRKLVDEINWNDRLIGIKGSRGVGKTSTLIQYAKDNFSLHDKRCLYVNLNNFYFTVKTIKDFANEFQMKGGEVLLIDQVFKYDNWAEELAYCYDNFPNLRIIFTGSSVLRLKDDHSPLANKVVSYNLIGFSFREFLELQTGYKFDYYSLEDILKHHEEITKEITTKVKPLAFLNDYYHHGFYPFHLEKRNFSENLLKTMNMMLEVDVLSINQIEQSYLSKLRKLLYILSSSAPCPTNISQLSSDIMTSRATVMNYIKYLKDARLVNLLYKEGDNYPKKPALVYMQNPNLLYATRMINVNEQSLRETFFYNQLDKDYKINIGSKNCQFLIDGKYHFNVGNKIRGKFNPDVYYAIDGIENGEGKVIPLWLFGFMY
ncbi:putative AAA+ superfamily ATPase [Dysgonomonadaceae bacterium PH5-43]|nr:putative AAA+ superfamily ATPase [Dysgonomonadaceae bacterium PH5-43]